MAVEIFHDSLSGTADRDFDRWRYAHLNDGFFLNPQEKGQMMLHRVNCPHLEFGQKVSLTRNRKVCATSVSDLRKWASENRIRIKTCGDCGA